MDRRSFFKVTAAAIIAPAVAKLVLPASPAIAAPAPSAPLYVPKERLKLGVPKHWRAALATPDAGHNIPMVLLQANYIPWAGGKLPEGAEVLVDRVTAERWIEHGVARAGTSAPAYLQEASARRIAERARGQQFVWERPGYWDADSDEDAPFMAGDWERVFASQPSSLPLTDMIGMLRKKT